MASKGRWSPSVSLAEHIYWHRTFDWAKKRLGVQAWESPTAEVVALAWQRAEAIAKRYQRMKRRSARKARNAAQR